MAPGGQFSGHAGLANTGRCVCVCEGGTPSVVDARYREQQSTAGCETAGAAHVQYVGKAHGV